MYLELSHQVSADSCLSKMAHLAQTYATKLNVYEELCHRFHQYLTFAGFLPMTLEGHRKEDVTSKVSDPPFTNLVQESDSNDEPMLIG